MAENETLRLFLASQSKVFQIIIDFFKASFKEIASKGFDLGGLKQIQVISSDKSLRVLEEQIMNLKSCEKQVAKDDGLGCMASMQAFLDLLEYLVKFTPPKVYRAYAATSEPSCPKHLGSSSKPIGVASMSSAQSTNISNSTLNLTGMTCSSNFAQQYEQAKELFLGNLTVVSPASARSDEEQ